MKKKLSRVGWLKGAFFCKEKINTFKYKVTSLNFATFTFIRSAALLTNNRPSLQFTRHQQFSVVIKTAQSPA